jgi:hypothetical protein
MPANFKAGDIVYVAVPGADPNAVISGAFVSLKAVTFYQESDVTPSIVETSDGSYHVDAVFDCKAAYAAYTRFEIAYPTKSLNRNAAILAVLDRLDAGVLPGHEASIQIRKLLAE